MSMKAMIRAINRKNEIIIEMAPTLDSSMSLWGSYFI